MFLLSGIECLFLLSGIECLFLLSAIERLFLLSSIECFVLEVVSLRILEQDVAILSRRGPLSFELLSFLAAGFIQLAEEQVGNVPHGVSHPVLHSLYVVIFHVSGLFQLEICFLQFLHPLVLTDLAL